MITTFQNLDKEWMKLLERMKGLDNRVLWSIFIDVQDAVKKAEENNPVFTG